ncbi:unnamed protein product, partial [Discosporangium mesarthrocarpum]
MYGMMCVVYSTGVWLLLASYLELPVSTTHSTVGGIVGMAMTYRGASCVIWHEDTDTFPFVKGISAIVASWAISPIFSGILAVLLFFVVRTLVLRSEMSFERSFYVYPLLVAATISINVFFIVYKGAKGLDLDETPLNTAFAWALGLGFGLGILMLPVALLWMKPRVNAKFNEDGSLKVRETKNCLQKMEIFLICTGIKICAMDQVPEEETKTESTTSGGIVGFVKGQLDSDIHASIKEDANVSAIHDNAEMFDPRTEEVFKYVQVFTAICDSFSHGANDVANAMGPFAAIYVVY